MCILSHYIKNMAGQSTFFKISRRTGKSESFHKRGCLFSHKKRIRADPVSEILIIPFSSHSFNSEKRNWQKKLRQ